MHSDCKHNIWLIAYQKALAEETPKEAEAIAVDAARRYQARWGQSICGESFDSLSLILATDDPKPRKLFDD